MSNTTYNKDFFQSLMNNSYEERMIYFNKCSSITDLEFYASEFYYKITKRFNRNMANEFGRDVCGKEKKLLEEILSARRSKMNRNFLWTKNHKKQLLELNDKIMNGFSMAHKEAEAQLHVLKDRIKSKDTYLKGFNIEICLKPFILEPNEDKYYLEGRGKGIYYLLYNNLPEILWSDSVGDEHDLNKLRTHKYEIDGENFNINEYLGKGTFDDSFICWGMYELFSINKILSWYDILKINEIWVEVKVTHQHFIENIGKGIFWDEGIQSLSDNEAENLRQEYLSSLQKDISGLPVTVWVDEMNCWGKTGPFRRIKFQGNKADKFDFRTMYSMSIEKEPRILVRGAQVDLTDEELQQVKDFVSKHRKLLVSMAKGNIGLIDFAEKTGLCKLRNNKNED